MQSSENLLEIIKSAVIEVIRKSTTSVPQDIHARLCEFAENEKNNPVTSSQIDLMIKNIDYGQKNGLPLCQDTGLVNFFVQLGTKFPFSSNFTLLFQDILAKLTKDAVLRPNTVDPITHQNQNFNGGQSMPPIYIDLKQDRDDLIITVLNKGGGAENVSRLFMLSPSNGLQKFPTHILSAIKQAGGNPCPPIIVGIGLGGDATKCMVMAKKALLRPLGSRNPRKEVAQMESKLLNDINALDIGIMGLGGHSNCLDVRIEWAMRHPASFPVGMIIECYSHRTVSCRITARGDISFGRLNANFDFEEGNW
jgi:fumarate hydratase subunit alpha